MVKNKTKTKPVTAVEPTVQGSRLAWNRMTLSL